MGAAFLAIAKDSYMSVLCNAPIVIQKWYTAKNFNTNNVNMNPRQLHTALKLNKIKKRSI